MSGYFNQMRHGGSEAARMLREKLARKEIGDAAYDKEASYTDERGFRIFGVIFIMAFAVIAFGVVWLD